MPGLDEFIAIHSGQVVSVIAAPSRRLEPRDQIDDRSPLQATLHLGFPISDSGLRQKPPCCPVRKNALRSFRASCSTLHVRCSARDRRSGVPIPGLHLGLMIIGFVVWNAPNFPPAAMKARPPMSILRRNARQGHQGIRWSRSPSTAPTTDGPPRSSWDLSAPRMLNRNSRNGCRTDWICGRTTYSSRGC